MRHTFLVVALLALLAPSVGTAAPAPGTPAALGAGTPVRAVQAVDVVPANRSALSGVHAIEAGSTLLVRGTTNRRPADNAIDVAVIGGPDADRIGFTVVETWDTDGAWSARLPIPADATPGAYTLRVQVGDEVDYQTFHIVSEKRATLTVRSAARPAVVVDATLPDGGYVELRTGETVVGVSPYLAPGTHERLSIPVEGRAASLTVVAVVGTRERRLDPYTHDGAPVSASVRLPTTTPTSTPEPTATPTMTPTSTPEPTATPTTTAASPTDTSGSGFGVVVAGVALVAGLILLATGWDR
ncbi:MAG: hypothetical protein ABEJ73_12735 [Haloplanus sp.]